MGKILLGLTNKEPEEIFLDFENAQPSEEEKDIHAAVAACLDKGPVILDRLLKYDGCEEFIRKAITTPGEETEQAAWNAVLPAVDQLQEFYDFSLELESCFPKVLVALCKRTQRQSCKSTSSCQTVG